MKEIQINTNTTNNTKVLEIDGKINTKVPGNSKSQIIPIIPNMEKRFYDLKERTFKFALDILDVSALLPKNLESDIIRKQLVRSGTSVGANIEEADGVLTKADFINKLAISRKEVKETKYWLNIIKAKYLKHEKIDIAINESLELVKIFSSIINKTR